MDEILTTLHDNTQTEEPVSELDNSGQEEEVGTVTQFELDEDDPVLRYLKERVENGIGGTVDDIPELDIIEGPIDENNPLNVRG